MSLPAAPTSLYTVQTHDRTHVACVTCRKRHIKCVPAKKVTERRTCVNCVRKNIVCEYLEVAEEQAREAGGSIPLTPVASTSGSTSPATPPHTTMQLPQVGTLLEPKPKSKPKPRGASVTVRRRSSASSASSSGSSSSSSIATPPQKSTSLPARHSDSRSPRFEPYPPHSQGHYVHPHPGPGMHASKAHWHPSFAPNPHTIGEETQFSGHFPSDWDSHSHAYRDATPYVPAISRMRGRTGSLEGSALGHYGEATTLPLAAMYPSQPQPQSRSLYAYDDAAYAYADAWRPTPGPMRRNTYPFVSPEPSPLDWEHPTHAGYALDAGYGRGESQMTSPGPSPLSVPIFGLPEY
ncbi:Zn(2)-C6 fungal-type domain-containing protein [Mycena chlorophos]|uniref:Zn(2)-C6 fungal-type domain-containing protein n=1 Tax=Mycena chlorophos TaxID=658473 RepID=A0A8H6TMZ0_MYCCL|nr:Zn(2)-C6 fungal-type domain-containing protein [Mycena chlorophos]